MQGASMRKKEKKTLTVGDLKMVIKQITNLREILAALPAADRTYEISALERAAAEGDPSADLLLIGLAELRDPVIH